MPSRPAATVQVGALILVLLGAYATGAAVEEQPIHPELLICAGVVLALALLTSETHVLASARAGHEPSLPSLVLLAYLLAWYVGWEQVRYGFRHAHWLAIIGGAATTAVCAVLFGVARHLHRDPNQWWWRGADAAPLTVLTLAAWAVLRAITATLDDESSWRLYVFASALTVVVLAVGLLARRLGRHASEVPPPAPPPPPVPPPPDPDKAPDVNVTPSVGPVVRFVEELFTALARAGALAAAGGAAYVLWRDHTSGDGVIPVMIFSGAALVLAFLGQKISSIDITIGGNEIKIDAKSSAGGPAAADLKTPAHATTRHVTVTASGRRAVAAALIVAEAFGKAPNA